MLKAQRTKEFIIEKTAVIFNTKGYSGTSINDLTNATGLTKGSIYGNFANKDEVALAAFDYNFKRVAVYIKTKMDAQQSIIDKLMVYPKTYRNFLKLPFFDAGCPILNTATEADDTHLKLKQKAANAFLYWQKALENQIQQGIKSNQIKPDIQVAQFVSVLISLVQGGVIQTKVTGNVSAINANMDFLEKLIEDIRM
jgi:TetR/AcrR family transcriptional regulator, transcriptional repressor for nem operon